MHTIFPYEEKESDVFQRIRRPIAEAYLWSKLINGWLRYKMIVDTGADYTILPRYCSVDLGINLKRDCRMIKTTGVGGKETVYFLKTKIKIKIDNFQLNIPLGFINSNEIPPLLGREKCLNSLRALFLNYQTELFTI